jgi:hypothetical protein
VHARRHQHRRLCSSFSSPVRALLAEMILVGCELGICALDAPIYVKTDPKRARAYAVLVRSSLRGVRRRQPRRTRRLGAVTR